MTLKDEIAAARDRLDEIHWPGAAKKRLAASAMYADASPGYGEPALRVMSVAIDATRSIVSLTDRDLRARAVAKMASLVISVEQDEDDADRKALAALEAEITKAEAEAEARKETAGSPASGMPVALEYSIRAMGIDPADLSPLEREVATTAYAALTRTLEQHRDRPTAIQEGNPEGWPPPGAGALTSHDFGGDVARG